MGFAGSGFRSQAAANAYNPNVPYLPKLSGRKIPLFTGTVGAGTAAHNNSIRFTPFFIGVATTIDRLDSLVTTVSAGGFVQFAIYASNANAEPTGAPLCYTTQQSTASAAAIQASTNVSVTLQPGLYFAASYASDATLAILSIASTNPHTQTLLGVPSSIANSASTTVGFGIVYSVGSFASGVWPDMTSNAVTYSIAGVSVNSAIWARVV